MGQPEPGKRNTIDCRVSNFAQGWRSKGDAALLKLVCAPKVNRPKRRPRANNWLVTQRHLKELQSKRTELRVQRNKLALETPESAELKNVDAEINEVERKIENILLTSETLQ